MGLFKNLFASYSEREIKKISHYVTEINVLEPAMEKLSDNELRAKTEEFKSRIFGGKQDKFFKKNKYSDDSYYIYHCYYFDRYNL